MSSRQSSVATSVSQNGLQYAAPNSFGSAQNDILLTNQSGNNNFLGLTNGTGSSGVQQQLIPILSSQGSNHGLTSSGTTATCTLASPHGYVSGTPTVTVAANNGSYNVTGATATITGAYTFTYTTTGSGLPTSDGGTVTIPVPNAAGTAAGSTGQAFSSSLVGATIRGSSVGTLEVWGDNGVWDLTNNRSLYPGIDFDAALLNKRS